jgi:hypothetical protein
MSLVSLGSMHWLGAGMDFQITEVKKVWNLPNSPHDLKVALL